MSFCKKGLFGLLTEPGIQLPINPSIIFIYLLHPPSHIPSFSIFYTTANTTSFRKRYKNPTVCSQKIPCH